MTLPKDPAILLSYINTQLRDHYNSLDEFCQSTDSEAKIIKSILSSIDYVYDEKQNRFI